MVYVYYTLFRPGGMCGAIESAASAKDAWLFLRGCELLTCYVPGEFTSPYCSTGLRLLRRTDPPSTNGNPTFTTTPCP